MGFFKVGKVRAWTTKKDGLKVAVERPKKASKRTTHKKKKSATSLLFDPTGLFRS